MHFSWFDLLLLASIAGYVWGGFWTGLIQSVGGLVGLFVGQIVASRWYEHFGNLLSPVFKDNHLVANIFAFILLFLLVSRLVGLLFWLVNKVFNFIAIIPGLKMVNRLGGAVFGLLEGALFIGITLQFLAHLPISTPFAGTIANSAMAKYFLDITAWLVPLFPAFIKNAENAVKNYVPAPTSINVNAAVNAANTIKNSGLLR